MLSPKTVKLVKSQLLRFHSQRKCDRWNLRLCGISRIQLSEYSTKQFANTVQIEDIDPRVEALREKIIYSEYLEKKYLRLGFKKNMQIKQAIETKQRKSKIEKLVNAPVYSVLLDKLSNIVEDNKLPLEEDNSNKEYDKPIHMPYAHIDKYEVRETKDIPDIDIKENSLNEEYKQLYERYLKAKQSVKPNKSVPLFPPSENSSKVPPNWLTDYQEYDDTMLDDSWVDNYGTPNPNTNVSPIPCGGCGSLLHCKDVALPGYLPSELFLKRSHDDLQNMICQRCHFLKFYNTALEVKVSADEYPELLKVIKTRKAAVILMVDLTDFPCSIWPDIRTVLHPLTCIFIVGNKVDLLPKDQPHFFDRVKASLRKSVQITGIDERYIKHVALVSAKTGYGIEELVNKLSTLWGTKGDVFLIGCTNVGKSSLFNALLLSDYCKVQAADLIQRATTSPWPGTTLNLLKFPILHICGSKAAKRTERLISEREANQMEQKQRVETYRDTKQIKHLTLYGHIRRTFRLRSPQKPSNDPFQEISNNSNTGKFGLDETLEIFKNSRWCYDTPGTIQRDQILDLLTTDELILTLPNQIISPRTFMLKPQETLFLAGLGRLDYVNGTSYIRSTVFASNELPITTCRTEHADEIYKELLHTTAFAVPINNVERLKLWPELRSKEMEVCGIGNNESAADIVLSSAGWLAITAPSTAIVTLKAWTPEGRGLHLRTPALLSKSVALRGVRKRHTPTYKKGKQVYVKF